LYVAKGNSRKARTRNYDIFLRKELKDREFAAEYLTAAVQDTSLEGFLIALKNVAEAHGGIGTLAKLTKLNRQSMYKMFSRRGNPTVSSLVTVLNAIGLDLSFQPQQRKTA
jgi:probable addiction module antidote protein